MTTPTENSNPFERALSPLLVFAVAGRIGSGATFVKERIAEELKAFGYHTVPIDVTTEFLVKEYESIFNDAVHARLTILGQSLPTEYRKVDETSTATRIQSLQQRGNDFRARYQRNILAALAIRNIERDIRKRSVFQSQERTAYLIDSLKHPDEVDLLRQVFGDAFCMVGVVADDNIRKKRLQEQKHINERDFDEISEIDADEKIKHGQQALKAILKSDYFFANNYGMPDEIQSECRRLLNLLFNSSIVTPRKDEFGMHMAFMAADGSACLSRQVGAAIVSEGGDVLATGCNDVPEFGGGLYSSESKRDERCYNRSGFCYNDDEKDIIADEIISAFKKEEYNLREERYVKIKRILLETRLKLLIEFSRAVHAEMDAIVTVARTAALGLVGSTMYVTTYPCHNCAKHIIDAGIHRVVFLEPYVKSLAQKLHSDAINNPLHPRSPDKVSFDNYGGVAPERYPKYFSIHGERKVKGKYVRNMRRKDVLLPITAMPVSSLEANLNEFVAVLSKSYKDSSQLILATTNGIAT